METEHVPQLLVTALACRRDPWTVDSRNAELSVVTVDMKLFEDGVAMAGALQISRGVTQVEYMYLGLARSHGKTPMKAYTYTPSLHFQGRSCPCTTPSNLYQLLPPVKMSLQGMMNPTPEAQTFDAVLKETKLPLRSWRKKYRKMKLRFDRAMDESNSLFKDYHKLEILAKRLQEENECVP